MLKRGRYLKLSIALITFSVIMSSLIIPLLVIMRATNPDLRFIGHVLFIFSITANICGTCHNELNPYNVWLHVSLNNDKGEEVLHIPVPKNPSDPNDKYFITSNAKVAYPNHSDLSEPMARDGL